MQTHWEPSATIESLRKRAQIIETIRAFFKARDILEVETPLLSQATVTDQHLHSFQSQYLFPAHEKPTTLYLQTSPEFAMKRLLCAGIGSIYTITKAFRDEERGRYHNPEFSMLEWYRVGFDHQDLMKEVNDLLKLVLETQDAEQMTYQALFNYYLDIDPYKVSLEELKNVVKKQRIDVSDAAMYSKDDCLQLLLTHVCEPHLGYDKPLFIYDYPATQAALARIEHNDETPIARRFEVYFKGVELANGFYELSDAKEQRERFTKDLEQRDVVGLPRVSQDERLLAALKQGLPDCAGVALGLDRLMMFACGVDTIDDVLSFTIENA